MRAADLLGSTVIGPAGEPLGKVLDVRLVQDGPLLGASAALRIDGFVVGHRELASRLGYDRVSMHGPTAVRRLALWLSRDNRYLRWSDVAELQPGNIRAAVGKLYMVPVIA